VQWHITNNNDPAIRWVVEQLAVAAAAKSARSPRTPGPADEEATQFFGAHASPR